MPGPAIVACHWHKRHAPAPTEAQAHHVIPQGWQGLMPHPPTLPAGAVAGKGQAGNVLWDARTESWCPTGHRRVHGWLVFLTRNVHLRIGAGATPDVALAAAIAWTHSTEPEHECAVRGITRWLEAGGTVEQLAAASQWGMA